MRNRFACLLLATLLLCPAIAARAEATQGVTAGLGDWMSRVKLREAPSQNAAVLGQYFADVRLTVLGATGEWALVRVGNREGYMMNRYLKPDVAGDSDAFEGMPGQIRFRGEADTLPLYTSPDTGSAVLAAMPEGEVKVLGTVGEGWLHVRWRDAGDQTLTGFADSTCITQAENMADARVDTGKAENRLHLRAAPSQGAASLGRYYCGTDVWMMFDDHASGDGWARVRIMDRVGYMMEQYLDYSSGGVGAFQPPLTVAHWESIPLFDTADAALAVDSVTDNSHVSVLGECGARYAVRIETGAQYVYRYGYVDKPSVMPVSRAARTAGTVKARQPLLLADGHGGVQPQSFTAPKGADIDLYGSARAAGGEVTSPYVERDAGWLMGSVQMADGTWAEGYLPVDGVTFDATLVYPLP